MNEPQDDLVDDVMRLEFEPAPWTQIPLELINDSSLSMQAQFLHVVITAHPPAAYRGPGPWRDRLTEIIECRRAQVDRSLRELRAAGWIRVAHEDSADRSEVTTL